MLQAPVSIPMHDPVTRESSRLPKGTGFGRGLECDSKYMNYNDLRSSAWSDETFNAGVCPG
jgi:hypothetical protein